MTLIHADYTLSAYSGSPVDSLVILLHGVGANGTDLIPLAEQWRTVLPNTDFVSPNAPFPYEDDFGWGDAYQWFSLRDITPENREERVRQVSPLLAEFIERERMRRSLSSGRVALVGFSQGTIMALYTALRQPHPYAAVLGYSGRLAGELALLNEIQSRPRILLVHGSADAVIPIQEMYGAKEILSAAAVPCIAVEESGIPHTISKKGESLGGRFLQYCFSDLEIGLENFSVPVV